MSLIREMNLTTSGGDYIGAHKQTDGDYHLGTAMVQSVYADTDNSSTTNLTLANSGTFTGIGVSTLGVVGLQWSLKTDQNCTVYVEQSPDNSNWDISYPFDYIASKGGRGETVQATQSYWRLRVVRNGTADTNYFRLQGVLCPIATPMGSELTEDGRAKVSATLYDFASDQRAQITPFGKVKTVEPVRTLGTSFNGISRDSNFWTEITTNGGSITQAGGVTLATSISPSGSAQYDSVRKARHVAGSANELKFTGRLVIDPIAGNVRRMGVYDDDNGFFFQVNGATFGVGARKGGVDTIVNSGSFNGDYGTTAPGAVTTTNFRIWYWEKTAQFFVNDKLLHKITATSGSLVNTNTLPIRMENNNVGSTIDNTYEILTSTVFRLGDLLTAPTSKRITTANTYVCKLGAGILHRIIMNSTAVIGTSLSIYDDPIGVGTTIGVVTMEGKATAPVSIEYGVPFNDGLTIIALGSWDVTVVYE